MSVSPANLYIERRSNAAIHTVTVSGSSSSAVSWALSGCTGDACGTISSGGLYTAPAMIPAKTTNSVTATLQSDSSKTSTATVTLQPLSVSVSPGSVSLLQGQTQQFTANVTGHSNKAMSTWSLSDCSGSCLRNDRYQRDVHCTSIRNGSLIRDSDGNVTGGYHQIRYGDRSTPATANLSFNLARDSVCRHWPDTEFHRHTAERLHQCGELHGRLQRVARLPLAEH